MNDRDLAGYLREQMDKPWFQALMERFEARQKDYVSLALQEGDTDYYKGQVAALKWVLAKPREIVTALESAQESEQSI